MTTVLSKQLHSSRRQAFWHEKVYPQSRGVTAAVAVAVRVTKRTIRSWPSTSTVHVAGNKWHCQRLLLVFGSSLRENPAKHFRSCRLPFSQSMCCVCSMYTMCVCMYVCMDVWVCCVTTPLDYAIPVSLATTRKETTKRNSGVFTRFLQLPFYDSFFCRLWSWFARLSAVLRCVMKLFGQSHWHWPIAIKSNATIWLLRCSIAPVSHQLTKHCDRDSVLLLGDTFAAFISNFESLSN